MDIRLAGASGVKPFGHGKAEGNYPYLMSINDCWDKISGLGIYLMQTFGCD